MYNNDTSIGETKRNKLYWIEYLTNVDAQSNTDETNPAVSAILPSESYRKRDKTMSAV